MVRRSHLASHRTTRDAATMPTPREQLSVVADLSMTVSVLCTSQVPSAYADISQGSNEQNSSGRNRRGGRNARDSNMRGDNYNTQSQTQPSMGSFRGPMSQPMSVERTLPRGTTSEERFNASNGMQFQARTPTQFINPVQAPPPTPARSSMQATPSTTARSSMRAPPSTPARNSMQAHQQTPRGAPEPSPFGRRNPMLAAMASHLDRMTPTTHVDRPSTQQPSQVEDPYREEDDETYGW